MSILSMLIAPRAAAKVPLQPVRGRNFWPGRHAGVKIDEDNALQYSAVWSCVRIISETIAALPWHAYQKVGKENSSRFKGREDWILYRQPNPEMSAMTLKEVIVAWALTWGNGYAEIERDAGGRPVALWPIAPHRVTPERLVTGELVYAVRSETGGDITLEAKDVFHLHGLGYDGIVGYSVIAMAAKSIGLGIACEQFGSNYFENGTHPGVVVTHPMKLTEQGHKNLEGSLVSSYSGLGRSHRLMLLEEAMKIEKITFTPEESQFLETRKFQIAEIARWFRMPLHKMSDLERSTNNNIEHQSIEFVTDTIKPWAVRLETEADIKLFGATKGRIYTKLNMNSLLRGDTKSRGEFYKIMGNLGVFSVNDILRLEDMNTIGPIGDKRLVQLNQTTLEKIGTEEIEPETPKQDDEERLQMIVMTAARDIVSRETKRAQSASVRYPDRKEFAGWIEAFAKDHQGYIRRKLQTPCEALAKIYEIGEESTERIIDLFELHHMRMIRDHLFEPDESADEQRAQGIVEFICEQAKQAAMLKGLEL